MPEPPDVWANPRARDALDARRPGRGPLEIHRRLPGYAPTPVRELPALAERLGLGRVLVKDERSRMGLPAFKVLGASYATLRALEEHRTAAFADPADLEAVRKQLAGAVTLVAATDGNHGRAVAWMAARLGCPARIFVPEDMVIARRDAIAGEGAQVVVVDGSYDDAVARAAAEATDDVVVVADTSWPGYDTVPRAVAEGYSTMLWEIEDADVGRIDAVAVPVGVGALASAVLGHVRGRDAPAPRARTISVEPRRAACAMASVQAGRPVEVPPPHRSIMSGLNCGRVSPLALPIMQAGFDVMCAIDDEVARQGMRHLAEEGIAAGECSGGAVGALAALLSRGSRWRAHLGLDDSSTVLTFLTEGVTDPDAYAL